MGRDPIWSLLFRFSLPAIISMTVASSYNLVDAIFIGKLGAIELAAMSVTFPLVLSFVAIASGTAVGVTSLISRSLGAGDVEMADRTAGVAVTLSFVLSGIIVASCLPFLDPILGALGANSDVLLQAKGYMSILIYFIIFSYLSMILANLIRADGNPVFASSVSIASALMNIILDPLFIFGIGPFPFMGIKGAAVATVIAQTMGTAVHAYYIVSGKTAYHFKFRYFLPRLRIIAEVYRVGMVSIVRSGAQFVVMGVMNHTAASFGVIPLAIMGVLVRIGRFVQMPILGLSHGILPVIGYNYGANQKARVAEVIFKTVLSGSVWTLLCWLVVMLLPTQVMSAFSGNGDFLREGTQAIRIYPLMLFALVMRMVPSLFFQGIGKGLPALILTVVQNIVFLLIPILLLPRFFGIVGLWIAFPVSDGLALIAGQLWMNIEFRRQGIRFLRKKAK